MTTPDPIQQIIEQEAYLRSLASRVTSDEHAAEDLVQQALLYVLEKPPRKLTVPRSWIAKVVRHFAINHTIKERARRIRETRVAMERAADANVEEPRPEVGAFVRKNVNALREPYRSAVRLRYFENHSPSDIAKQNGVSVHTVKTRLRRAREMLRDRMARGGADRAGFRSLILLCLVSGWRRPGHWPNSRWFGATIVLGAVSTLWMLSLFVSAADVGARHPETARLAAPTTGAPPRADLRPFGGPSTERKLVPTSEDISPAAVHSFEVECLAVDETGAPLPDIPLTFAPDAQRKRDASTSSTSRATTDHNGRATLRSISGRGEIRADARSDWSTFYSARINHFAPSDPLLVVVGRRITITGSVIDEEGRHVPHASVNLMPLPSLVDALTEQHGLRHSKISDSLWVTADETGRFRFDGVPHIRSAGILARATGFANVFVPLEVDGSTDVQIELRNPSVSTSAPTGRTRQFASAFEPIPIRGTVVDARGHPVRNALVTAGKIGQWTDDLGGFSFALDWRKSRVAGLEHLLGDAFPTVTAVAVGHQPAEAQVDQTSAEPIRLTLGPPPNTVRGTVTDPRGRPLAGILVGPSVAVAIGTLDLERHSAGLPPSNAWARAETDAMGGFEVHGLSGGTTRLVAFCPSSGMKVVTAPFDESVARLDIVLDRNDVWREVRGHVIDSHGKPVVDGSVSAIVDTQALSYGGTVWGQRTATVCTTHLREDGSFILESVPRQHAYLGVSTSSSAKFERDAPTLLEARDAEIVDGIELRVARSAEVEILFGSDEQALRFRALDANGQIAYRTDRRVLDRPALRRDESTLVQPGSVRLSLPDDARRLVLYRRREVVGTIELNLSADVPNVIDLRERD